jgi:uncharacterized phage protein gp47/JayE
VSEIRPAAAAAANGFQRETLPQLIERAQTDIEANLRGAVARLPQTNLDALACMSAGMADEQLEAIDFYATQIHVTTARGVWLERHGAEWGVLKREATRASGILDVTVADANVPVPRGALFQTAARWQIETTQAVTSIAPGVIQVPAQAVETGAAGNLETATRLNTVTPIVGVTTAVVAAPGFAGGNPREGEELYRSRILDRIQQPPQGGAAYDYRRWMLEYPGCTRAWVFPREQGTGTVVCRFAMDETYPDGIPPAAEVARMTQWLDLLRPVTAEVFVYAPIPRPINVVVRDLFPNNAPVRNAVEDELRDMLMREGDPGAIMRRSWFWEAVSIAAGERHHTLDEPAADVPLAIGEIAVLGTLEFVFTPVPPPRRR